MTGIIAIKDFPFYPNALFQLKRLCDKVVVRLDKDCQFINGEMEGLEIFRSDKEWNTWNWREELIRRVSPCDIVVNLDDDETFGEGIKEEIEKFRKSDKLAMMFNYEMVTEDRRKVEVYPALAHCKVFKWREGLTYRPYAGLCLPTQYANTLHEMKGRYWESEVKIKHWCMFTKEMEEKKVKI